MTSGLDDRYGIGKITSRMGPQCDAMVFTCTTDFDNVALFEGIDELILDEAQFLTGSQVRQIHRMASKKRQRISCYGLRTDFQGNPFEGAAMLLALADNLHAISTLCQCGAVATMNQRVDKDGQAVRDGAVLEIGGDNRYRPVCAICFYA